MSTHHTGENVITGVSTTVVTARDLHQVYSISNGFMRKPIALQAVSGVSFAISAGKTLAIVG